MGHVHGPGGQQHRAGGQRGVQEVVPQAAEQLGRCIAASGDVLVFGGGADGLMGACAEGASGAEIIGVKPETIPTLRAAMDRGLVPRNLSGLNVDRDPRKFRPDGFRTVTPQSSVFFHILGDGPLGRTADFLAGRVFTPFPKPEPDLCIGCGKCAATCPAKAITMREGKPQIDRRTCIHCFCCQEFCPKGAIKVGKGFLLRLLG